MSKLLNYAHLGRLTPIKFELLPSASRGTDCLKRSCQANSRQARLLVSKKGVTWV